MKKVLLLVLLTLIVGRLKAQQFVPLNPADTIKGRVQPKGFFEAPNGGATQWLTPDLKMYGLQSGDNSQLAMVTFSPVDHMPVIKTPINSKMPVVKLYNTSKMPVLKLNRDGNAIEVQKNPGGTISTP